MNTDAHRFIALYFRLHLQSVCIGAHLWLIPFSLRKSYAYCPEIPGANGQGLTVEECRANLAKAIALILEDKR